MNYRKKQKVIAALAGVIGALLVTYAGITYFQSYSFKKYADDKAGFSVRYPKNWAYASNKDGVNVLFYSPPESEYDAFTENVNIVVQDISREPMDLPQYTALAVKQMTIVFEGKMEIIESVPARLGTRKGHKFVFLTREEAPLKMMMVWTLKGNWAYQFTYLSQPDTYNFYMNDVQKMLKSFRITR